MQASRTGAGMTMFAVLAGAIAWCLLLGGDTTSASAPAQSGTLAFTTLRPGPARIASVKAGGGGLTQLTHTRGAAFEGGPAFSPDGRRIAYVCGNFELCVMNADGSASTRLTTNDWPREYRYDRDPAWSPDGTRIAFARSSAGRTGIWVIGTDGSGLRQLPAPRGHNANPAFSPDGRAIAFDHVPGSGVSSMGNKNVYVIGVDGGAPRRLTQEDDSAADPAWSPDGSRLVFSRADFDNHAQLVVVDADGRGERRLRTGSISATHPAWSPDGATIAFAGRRAGRLLIYTVASGGGAPVRVTGANTTDLDPAWQPSGPAADVALPTAPPSRATADARVAAAVMQALVELLAELKSDPTTSNASEAATAATRVRGTVRRVRSATTKLRVSTARGKRVRRALLASMRAAGSLADHLSELSRSLRRQDRRAVKSARNDLFGDGIATFFPLSEAAELAEVPHADISL